MKQLLGYSGNILVVAFTGQSRSGKTTAADMLMGMAIQDNPDCFKSILGVGDLLKESLEGLLGLNSGYLEAHKHQVEVRKLLQHWGDIKKELGGESCLLNELGECLISELENLNTRGPALIIIPDLRLEFEAHYIKRYFQTPGKASLIIKLFCNLPSTDQHKTEQEWRRIDPDLRIFNDNTLDYLEQQLLNIYITHIKPCISLKVQ